jgi:predicted nucleic acid-binding protein
VPDRYLIDTHIYDKIVDTPGALALVKQLVAAGRVSLLSTHVQADEIAATPDRERAGLLAAVPVELVPTSGAVYGTSAFGMARYGEPESFESLHGGNPKHTEDALIAATAQFEDATLVTEDVTLTKRATREGIAVIAWDVLYARLAAGGSSS